MCAWIVRMEDFIKAVSAVGAFFSPVMRWIVMKKDSELPWVIRLARWGALAFLLTYGLLLIAEKAKAVFS